LGWVYVTVCCPNADAVAWQDGQVLLKEV